MKRLTIIALLIFSASIIFAQEEKDANHYINKGNEAYKAKDYATAFESFKTAVTIKEAENIVDTSLIYNTGYCAYKTKNYEEASN